MLKIRYFKNTDNDNSLKPKSHKELGLYPLSYVFSISSLVYRYFDFRIPFLRNFIKKRVKERQKKKEKIEY